MIRNSSSNRKIIQHRYEDIVSDIVTSCLSLTQYQQLESDPFSWHDTLTQFVLQAYARCCDLVKFKVSLVDSMLFEPIVLYVKPEHIKEQFNHTEIIHVFSTQNLREIFTSINEYEIDPQECSSRSTFHPPAVFTKPLQQRNFKEKKLSTTLSNKLLRLYVVCDHAAYHYFELVKNKNCDYIHRNINRKKIQNAKNVRFFHNLLSATPNASLTNFTQEHEIQKREDSEAPGSFVNDFDKMFVLEAKDDEDISKKLSEETDDSLEAISDEEQTTSNDEDDNEQEK